MYNLLIVSNDAEAYATHLRSKSLPDLEISIAENSEQAQGFIHNANIILGVPALVAPLLDKAANLQWVQSSFAGVELFCDSDIRTDYTLTGVKDMFGQSMSEYVFGYILALERNLFVARENQIKKHWKPIPYRRLDSLTIGICGLGSIGRAIAKTAAHFGMSVLGLSRSAKPVAVVENVYKPAEITELAQQVDYLVTVLPNTSATRGIIGRNVLDALGPKGVLINAGRGATVDEQALIAALQANAIRGVVLDVFQSEPLSRQSPLWELDNVFITPHNAAVTFAEDIVELFCDNYRRFQAGESLHYVVDFDRQY
ncbi:D-2-hydroxyacid dehydrogenase [Porticoccus sp. GXU_MW_L64]